MFKIRNLLASLVILASLISYGCQPRVVTPVTTEPGLTNVQAEARAHLEAKGMGFTERDFFKSAQQGDTASVELYLRAGMNLNYQSPKTGYTPLMWAAERGQSETLEALIERGADVHISNTYGWNALMGASINCYPETVEILVNAGMDVNAKDKGEWTALMQAARNRCAAVVQTLIHAGADVNATDNRGKTALSITRVDSIKAMLRAAGARE